MFELFDILNWQRESGRNRLTRLLIHYLELCCVNGNLFCFPSGCGLYIVGSSVTGFGGSSSDMDLCLMVSKKEVCGSLAFIVNYSTFNVI